MIKTLICGMKGNDLLWMWVDSPRSAFSQLWKEYEEIPHRLSTGTGYYEILLYFARLKNYPPYMGGSFCSSQGSFALLSTVDATYPQITMTYPQKGCLNKQS